jgi:hypothetical protein
MQNRICKHRLVQVDAFYETSAHNMVPTNHHEITLCNWLLGTTSGKLPPPVYRQASHITLHDADCDHCPYFEAVPSC